MPQLLHAWTAGTSLSQRARTAEEPDESGPPEARGAWRAEGSGGSSGRLLCHEAGERLWFELRERCLKDVVSRRPAEESRAGQFSMASHSVEVEGVCGRGRGEAAGQFGTSNTCIRLKLHTVDTHPQHAHEESTYVV